MINTNIPLDQINAMCANTMMEHLGIEYTEVGEDYLCAKMPVNKTTHQPLGLLHGGASVTLAESLGSAASALMLDPSKAYPVGLEINANHVKSVRDGYVYGKATLVHGGRKTHIWDIRITGEEEQLVCISRLTIAVIERS